MPVPARAKNLNYSRGRGSHPSHACQISRMCVLSLLTKPCFTQVDVGHLETSIPLSSLPTGILCGKQKKTKKFGTTGLRLPTNLASLCSAADLV